MNTGSGKDLNWFWKRWFFDNGVPDLAIKKVSKAAAAYNIIIDCKGHKPVPVDLLITFVDGTKTSIHRSIAVWEKANSLTLSIPSKGTIKSVTLGSTYVPDINRKDNVWEK